ncbi:molecular chaperone GrpE [Mycoplasma testudineum]|uniref:Protein GrpE n=1 Tax=Mycoplasma testudineum TaxID=244584 RepID=A0A4R6IE23_9MOLU|nr:nucleotide exchange factor GrpE [Mycoplasma testudineum]OYD26977.1 nucleotide exchange factor GrpE [Mycoplasma testudineum]TDO20523.1 molecular chaperone GrpE [Mycoplasma testudineum]
METYSKGDKILVDVSAFNGEDVIKKWERTNMVLELGENQYIDGFDDLIIGKEKMEYYSLKMDYLDKKTEEVQEITFEVHNKIDRLEEFIDVQSESEKKESKKDNKWKQKYKDELKKVKDLEEKNSKLQEKLDLNLKLQEIQLKSFESKAKTVIEERVSAEKSIMEQHISEAKKYSAQKMLEDALPIIHNIEKAISYANKSENQEVKNYVIGFSHLLNQLERVFEDHNIIKISPIEGDLYDPEKHDILETVIDLESENDTVKEATSSGFMLHDRIIIPSKVRVVKNPEKLKVKMLRK